MFPRLAKFAVALVAGIAVWMALAAPLTHFIAWSAAPLLHLDERFRDALLTPGGTVITMKSPVNAFPGATFPGDQLTFNLILLIALFGSNRNAFRDRNIAAFAVSLLLLLLTYPLSFVTMAEAYYAMHTGAWGEVRYGELAGNAWLAAEMFWRLVGMFGLVFGCWWIGSTRTR
ncbi:MAG TPA: hypothetical protein VF824_21330 [Thermoanaerobaculia bacterium]|jgi:hypothetical protein